MEAGLASLPWGGGLLRFPRCICFRFGFYGELLLSVRRAQGAPALPQAPASCLARDGCISLFSQYQFITHPLSRILPFVIGVYWTFYCLPFLAKASYVTKPRVRAQGSVLPRGSSEAGEDEGFWTAVESP